MRTLVAYFTWSGNTKEIAERIARKTHGKLFRMMADEMLSRSDTFTPDHYVFYQKDGGYHDFDAVQEYMYNALPLFFRQ